MANQQPLLSLIRNLASRIVPAQTDAASNESVGQNQWYQHAQKMFARKDYWAALEAAERARLKHPQSDDVWQLYGAILQAMGRPQAAQASLERAIELNEANAAAWESLSQIHTASGQSDEALKCYQRAAALKPEATALATKQVEILTHQQKSDEALALAEKLSTDFPADANGWTSRGEALAQLERNEEAIACYQQAIQLTANQPQVWFKLGCALHASARFDEAANAYEHALELNEYQPQAWHKLGLIRLDDFLAAVEEGRLDEAQPLWWEAVNTGHRGLTQGWYQEEFDTLYTVAEMGHWQLAHDLLKEATHNERLTPLKYAVHYQLTGKTNLLEGLPPAKRVAAQALIAQWQQLAA
ncbi:MAG: tetratricopeptide repeat protein [Acidobacteria bacterium]|nr:tetratricopeptide repeat protein [Acidobacteriota bacterium]